MTVIVVALAHCPAVGVNEYVVVAEVFIAGDQVPVIPFVEVAGNVKAVPMQTGATGVNAGVTAGLMTTVIVAGSPH